YMKRLDRFILKSFIGPFVAILLVVMFILVMQFLWVYIDELVGKGLSFSVILEFLMWGGCTILPLAMPLATLLASMWTIGQMSENNELIAVKSAGVSLVRIMAPLFISSAIISVLAFYSANDLVPVAYDKIYTLRDDINKTKDEIKIPAGIFYDGIDGYVLRIQDRNDASGMMYGVMVYDHTGNKGNTSVTLADSALMKMSSNKDYLSFSLYNGTTYNETNTRQYRDTILELQKLFFRSQDLIIPLENYSFEKSDSTRFSDQIKSMNLEDLTNYQDTLHKKYDIAYDAQKKTFNSIIGFEKRIQLDTSVRRKNLRNFEDESFMKWETPESKANAYAMAAEKAKSAENELRNMNRDVYEYQFYIRRADLEVLRRFVQALACLILFFIGAPLGSFVRKGGLGAAAIISVLFFVLYWVVDLTGSKLAKDGAISPASGAFIPLYVLVPIGVFLVWKATQDSSFNTDQFKASWRKFKTRVVGMFKKTRIVYMGTPEFAVAPLKALIDKGYEIAGVVTVADKPSGRGLKVNESAVKKFAVEHGIPVLQPVKLKDPEFLEALRAWKADIFVVVAFRMLPEEVWTMPKLGTFNLHAALLPQYRGAAPINWAVINGEKVTGVTTFMIDHDIDTGGIILREECRIKDTDTAGDVHDRLMEMGASLVEETVEAIIQGNAELRVQRSFIQGAEVLKPAPKLTRELCHIDWNDTTEHIYNLIRGLSPYPAAFTELVPASRQMPVLSSEAQHESTSADLAAKPVQMKIFAAERMTADDLADFRAGSASSVGFIATDGLDASASALSAVGSVPAPGTVISDGKSLLAVATADGAIRIRELQLAGKKRMDVESFLLGFRNPQSYTCTPGTSKA
ncbi:MAG: methionyl-tRNA formyltransferase, partial [Bacteroidales bacterium]|nr:methionyl-tRNA formyltransferase [Bacteroidales bacterium]